MIEQFINPRETPARDSRYMGLAWIYSAFSKDPNTQCGAVIVSVDNELLGMGYNGPPAGIDDDSFSWSRPPKDNPDAFSKYSVVKHSERNAIDHSDKYKLEGSTLYVTGHPCKDCMVDIIDAKIARIVYMDYKSDGGSMLRATQREVSEQVAGLSKIKIEKFTGNLLWLPEWFENLRTKGVFDQPA